MTEKIDFKKEYKDLYLPPKKPSIIEVPSMQFITVAGIGNPNDEKGEYSAAVGALYALSYTIKMSKMSGSQPKGYFDYVVAPLEGLWWLDDFVFTGEPIKNKGEFQWISMIRQPDFVTPEVFAWACDEVARKKPEVDATKARLVEFNEGTCVQIMHIGSYDQEPASIEAMTAFAEAEGYLPNFSDQEEPYPLAHRHHEIYLGDPRRTKPENLKTVIRHPVRKI